MIVLLRLPLNVAHIILGWVLLMLFWDFKAWRLRSIPTLPVMALSFSTQMANVQPLPVSFYFHHHHHHIVLAARISLTLSRHSSLSFIALGRSSGQHPVSSHSCWMYVRAGRPAFARPCVGIHKSTSLMSSSLLLQQCPACLVRLTWIDFVMVLSNYFYLIIIIRLQTVIWFQLTNSNNP